MTIELDGFVKLLLVNVALRRRADQFECLTALRFGDA
jgi:hypothetical protein